MCIMKRFAIILMIIILLGSIFLLIRKSIPYSDRPDLLKANISIDSVWQFGPAAAIYDRSKRQYYWMKSYTDVRLNMLDTLKSRAVQITYVKYLMGPLENRITQMEVDSLVVFDQVVERE